MFRRFRHHSPFPVSWLAYYFAVDLVFNQAAMPKDVIGAIVRAQTESHCNRSELFLSFRTFNRTALGAVPITHYYYLDPEPNSATVITVLAILLVFIILRNCFASMTYVIDEQKEIRNEYKKLRDENTDLKSKIQSANKVKSALAVY